MLSSSRHVLTNGCPFRTLVLHVPCRSAQPKGAKPRRRGSFEPDQWELAAKLRAMQEQSAQAATSPDGEGRSPPMARSSASTMRSGNSFVVSTGRSDVVSVDSMGSSFSLSRVATDHLIGHQ